MDSADAQDLSAVARALGVVEIYENILINLNYHDLVTCLRVNKHTEAVILRSTALRKISWLEPDEPCPMEDISGQLVPADIDFHPILEKYWWWWRSYEKTPEAVGYTRIAGNATRDFVSTVQDEISAIARPIPTIRVSRAMLGMPLNFEVVLFCPGCDTGSLKKVIPALKDGSICTLASLVEAMEAAVMDCKSARCLSAKLLSPDQELELELKLSK